MKVVYEKSIAERLREAVREAAQFGRRIEYIELTERERRELDGTPVNTRGGPFLGTFMDVDLRLEDTRK